MRLRGINKHLFETEPFHFGTWFFFFFFCFFFSSPSSSEHILHFRVWKPAEITAIVKSNLTYLYKIFITCKYLEALFLIPMKAPYARKGELFHVSENGCVVD